MRRGKGFVSFALVALSVGMTMADDLTGANKFLCAPKQATACWAGEECSDRGIFDANIPQFIEVDLDKKVLSTTRTSEENRSSPIRSVLRDQGLIVIQGYEDRRAFSFVVAEATGIVTITVAGDDEGVVGFGVCTPVR